MGTHFLGIKKLKKLSNKFDMKFSAGCEYGHEKGNIFYLLKADNRLYEVTITKQKEAFIKEAVLDTFEFSVYMRSFLRCENPIPILLNNEILKID